MISTETALRDTADLVGIDSQNPGILEGRCAEWVGNRLADCGLDVLEQQVDGSRHNLVSQVAGGDGPRLVLLAHMDTVPIGEGWTTGPLGAGIADGKLFGRGACDMKAGLAVAINTLDWLARGGATPSGDVVLVATVDEEAPDMMGAHTLVRSGLLRADDQVLALEPTGMRLRIAQMGLRWLDLHIKGRMAHAGRAHLGIDANHVAARIVDRLKTRVAEIPYDDEILGRPRITCGVLGGGVAPNVVPPSARAQLDMRYVPPMGPEDVIELVESVTASVISEFPGASFSLDRLGADRPPVRAAEDAKIVRGLRQAYRMVAGREVAVGGGDGHEAYTDASMVAALTGSASCTVLGPGATDQAHTADEFVPLSDVDLCCRLLSRLLTDW